jgi:hypothetical protein
MTATDKEHGLATSPILGPYDNNNMFSTRKLKDDIQNL